MESQLNLVQTTRNEYFTASLPGPVFTWKQLNLICVNSAWENKIAQQLNSHFISLLFNYLPLLGVLECCADFFFLISALCVQM